MMDLWERMMWLTFGGLIGFVLGYIVRSLHDIREKVDHVDRIVDGEQPSKWKNERGFMRHPVFADIAMLIVVTVTVFAAFQTAQVNQDLQNTVTCVTNYNKRLGQALGSRDHSIRAGTQSEIHLWTEYGKLYAQAEKDPSKIPALQKKLNQAIGAHRAALSNLQETRNDTPYPDPNILNNCK